MPLGLATCCNINYDPLASIKRLFSVPRCCVLPEDMVSGLAMQGKPVALSQGATVRGATWGPQGRGAPREERFDFVEVMACPGGCVAGAGQPFARSTEKRMRAEGLYKNDKALQIKRSEENPLVETLYGDLLKNREHELLHVEYRKE